MYAPLLYNKELWQLANARDVMTSRVLSVTPGDNADRQLIDQGGFDDRRLVSPGEETTRRLAV